MSPDLSYLSLLNILEKRPECCLQKVLSCPYSKTKQVIAKRLYVFNFPLSLEIGYALVGAIRCIFGVNMLTVIHFVVFLFMIYHLRPRCITVLHHGSGENVSFLPRESRKVGWLYS